jgi:hypothetical protein
MPTESAFTCFVWFSERRAIIYLYSIDLIRLYNQQGACLLCGMNWNFKYNSS